MADLLMAGVTTTLVQNRVYALPADRCLLYASAAIESAFTEGGAFTALTGANVAPGVETAAPFVRSTGVGTVVSIKT